MEIKEIKHVGEQALSYLVEKCKATFALITHKHTAEEVGADPKGSASAALALSQTYTDTEVEELGAMVAYIDESDNENVENPDISATSITIDSALSDTSTNPIQNKVVTNKLNELSEQIGDHSKDTSVHVTNKEKETWNNKSNFSGSYNDLKDKPTIPTVPTSLKNPYKLTISLGDSSYTYDGSKAVSITIEDGSEVIY